MQTTKILANTKSKNRVTIASSTFFEYRKLAFTMAKIQTEFFQKHGFVVTYEPSNLSNSVILPAKLTTLSTTTWKEIFERYKRNEDFYMDLRGTDLPELFEIAKQQQPINCEKLTSDWEKIENNFFEIFDANYNTNHLIKQIKVFVTKYGTRSSYCYHKKTLYILLRNTDTVNEIGFCILAGLFSNTVSGVDDDSPINNYTWYEKQRVIDFLMTNTQLNKLFPNFVPILDTSAHIKINPKTILLSNKIFSDLGYPINKTLRLMNGKIYLGEKQIIHLGNNEVKALEKLIQNENEIVSFESLADAIWGSDENDFYSLEAINKIIERIRKHLKELGLRKEIIHTKKKMGYMYCG